MPCYGPLRAWKSADVNPETGRRPLVFRKDQSHSGVPVEIPCGQCIGCKLERSRQWAMRCVHEMKLWNASLFLTLTYSEDTLPPHGSLRKRDLQLFMKRLRDRKFYHEGLTGVRFYACGEYGERTLRPHYHVLLLNTTFADLKKRSWGPQTQRHETYVSAEVSQLWPYGQNVCGEVNFESCAYVARYCAKVVGHREDASWYRFREKEFALMSRRPGLGTGYFEKYHNECYAHDNVIIDGREAPLNRFYDTKYELREPEKFAEIKARRRRVYMRRPDRKHERSSRRQWTKEQVAIRTIAHFKKDEL